MPAAKPLLQVFVANHCRNCDEARRIAREAQARFADLRVEVVDLEAGGGAIPPEVFATPTYLLDGRVVSLGNPTFEGLSSRLSAYITSRASDGSSARRSPGEAGVAGGEAEGRS